jgi:hypothetical protein
MAGREEVWAVDLEELRKRKPEMRGVGSDSMDMGLNEEALRE